MHNLKSPEVILSIVVLILAIWPSLVGLTAMRLIVGVIAVLFIYKATQSSGAKSSKSAVKKRR